MKKSDNSKRSNISPFVAMEMMAKANLLESKGKDVIHMDVGEPGFNTPNHVLDFVKSNIKEKNFGYTEALGMPELREQISIHYKYWYKKNIDPDCIAVTVGASGAFILSLLASFDVGDKVGIMRPYYPAYLNAMKALGLKVIVLDSSIEEGYQPSYEILKKTTSDLKGLVIASPANPTGSIIQKQQLKEVVEFCKSKNVRIISDEIYHGIEYDGFSNTLFSFNKNTLVINSFSKYFSMTGWRLGWILASKEIIKIIEKLSMAFVLCPPNISQLAAIKVFEDYEMLNKNVTIYKNNRDLLIDAFESVNLKNYAPPNGAFYIYLNINEVSNNSSILASRLLNEVGVSSAPGIDFDDKYGKNFIRFSYAGPTQKIKEGADRIKNWLKNN